MINKEAIIVFAISIFAGITTHFIAPAFFAGKYGIFIFAIILAFIYAGLEFIFQVKARLSVFPLWCLALGAVMLHGWHIWQMKAIYIGLSFMTVIYIISIKINEKKEHELWGKKQQLLSEIMAGNVCSWDELLNSFFFYSYIPDTMPMIKHNQRVIELILEKFSERFSDYDRKFMQEFLADSQRLVSENSLMWSDPNYLKELYIILHAKIKIS